MDVMWPGRTRRIERPPIAAINRIADRLARQGRDLIDLGQAIVGLPPPAAAMDAVRTYLSQSTPHAYSPDPGLPSTREQVARFLRSRKGIPKARAEQVILTCGANQAFVNAVLALTEPGDEIILFGPNYFDHLFAIQLAGCIPIELAMLRVEGRHVVDPEMVEKAITGQTKAVVLISPNNPTATVTSPDDLIALAEICERHGLWLISDEVYDLITFAPNLHISPASLEVTDRVIVLGSFSKCFAMAGWRIGYHFGPPALNEEIIKVQDALVVCAPVAAQKAVEATLDDSEPYIARLVSELTQRREVLMSYLSRSAMLDPALVEGGTFAFCRIRDCGETFEFCQKLLCETGVVTIPGSAFGPHGDGCVRISFGNQPIERIRQACERMQDFEKRCWSA